MATRSVARRVLRWLLLVFIVFPLGLLALSTLGYLAYGWWARGGTDDTHTQYLRTHQLSVAAPGELRFDRILDSSFYQHQLLLLGEPHGCAVPQGVDLALLRHLNQRLGVRHYVAEIDPAQAYLFNDYLRTGDEEPLRAVFSGWDGSAQWGNQDFYDKVRAIRALNATVPPARRVVFIGLDRLQDYGLFGRYLAVLRRSAVDSAAAPALDSVAAALARAADPNAPPVADSTIARLARQAQAQLPAAAAADSVGTALHHAIRNLTYLGPKRIRRDSVMALNLRDAYATGQLAPTAKAYGLWGLAHVARRAPAGVPPQLAELAPRVSLPKGGTVGSIATLLVDCRMMLPANAAPPPLRPATGARTIEVPMSQDGPLVFVRGINDVKAATQPRTLALCRLDAPGSPYRVSQRLAAVRAPLFNQTLVPTDEQAVTTDFFQYVLVVRDGPAVRPLAPTSVTAVR